MLIDFIYWVAFLLESTIIFGYLIGKFCELIDIFLIYKYFDSEVNGWASIARNMAVMSNEEEDEQFFDTREEISYV